MFVIKSTIVLNTRGVGMFMTLLVKVYNYNQYELYYL